LTPGKTTLEDALNCRVLVLRKPHQGKRRQGKTPMETFKENLSLAKEKMLDTKDKVRLALTA